MTLELAGLVILTKDIGPSITQWLTRRAVLNAAQRIEKKIDDSLLRAAFAGYDHLSAAVEAKTEGVRRQELLLARNRFSELCHLDPNEILTRRWLWVFRRQSINPTALICAGYHGSYCYFAISGETDLALKSIYRCAVLYPSETLNYFPDIKAFFSRDYLAELTELHQEHYEWETKLRSCYGRGSDPNVAADMDAFYREMVLLEDKIQEVLLEVRRESVLRLRQLDEGLDESTLGLHRIREALQLDN